MSCNKIFAQYDAINRKRLFGKANRFIGSPVGESHGAVSDTFTVNPLSHTDDVTVKTEQLRQLCRR